MLDRYDKINTHSLEGSSKETNRRMVHSNSMFHLSEDRLKCSKNRLFEFLFEDSRFGREESGRK